jgi:hypothetical protein
MKENVRNELRIIRDTIIAIENGRVLYSSKQRLFCEYEILEWLYEAENWSPNIKVLIYHFFDIAKRYGKFVLGALKLSVLIILEIFDDIWAVNAIKLSRWKSVLNAYFQQFVYNETPNLRQLLEIQQCLFDGNSISYRKTETDMLIIEAFINSLDEFNGASYESNIKVIRVKDYIAEFPIVLVKGLVIEEHHKIRNGVYNLVHFSESKNIIGIPTALSALVNNDENITLTTDAANNYAQSFLEHGCNIIICQKLILGNFQIALKVSPI